MRLSKVLGVKRAKMRAKVLTLGIIITGLLSIAFVVITFYGQNTGNFTMSVDYEAVSRGIILSETEDFENPRSQLTALPIGYARDITYNWLKLDEVHGTDGAYVDPDYEYVAYTFYVLNNGFETVDINYHIRISDVHKDLDGAVRFLVIEDGVESIFQKEDQPDEFGNMPYYPSDYPPTQNFLSENTVMRGRFTNFKPGNVKKFSIVIWLEGYDPDTNDSVMGGMLKSFMNFSIERPE